MERISFPEGFTWGAASAAYRVEGSPLADGAGPTTWHEFSHRKGMIRDGTNGDVAFHMEEPAWLARMGGFVNRQAVDHLVELGSAIFKRLGDRVRNWITINEPTIRAACGYFLGEFPPGPSAR